jgi:DNA-binding FadR family transcriptional regulator
MKNVLKIKPQSRSDLVVENITKSIINSELSDGELLPSENKLCEMFGVSRSILRESIRVLASKGLVKVRQGYGTLVCAPKDHIPEEAFRNYLHMNSISLIQLMEVRKPIEIEIARLAAVRRKEEHVKLMEQSLQIMQCHTKDIRKYVEADDEFHKALVEATGNPIFGIIIRSIIQYLHLSRRLTISNYGIDIVIAQHGAILESIKKKEISSAAKNMKVHMDVTLTNLKKLERSCRNT